MSDEQPAGARFDEANLAETAEPSGRPIRSEPVKRMRWATHRANSTKGRAKRKSILDRLHKRSPSALSGVSEGTDSDMHKSDGDASEATTSGPARTIYFNRQLPPEAKDENGHPLITYPRNKIRTARYTALSFIPKDLWFQFHNIANIYFLIIILLAIAPQLGVQDPGLNAVPLIVIVTLTAIKDAIEDTRRTILDTEINNSPAHRLVDWDNVNTGTEKVGPWRRFKKANTRAMVFLWRMMKLHQSRAQKKEAAAEEERERGTAERPTRDLQRDSTFLDRQSWVAAHGGHGLEMADVQSPGKDLEEDAAGPPSYTQHLGVPGNNGAADTRSLRRDYGTLLDPTRETAEKARFKKDYWKSCKVGDFIRLYNGEEVPADVVVLSTSDPDGACYVETKNLDGETNLKVRQALRCGRRIRRARDCEKTDFIIESEPPQPNLYTYSGVCKWEQKDPKDPGAPGTPMAEPVSINNMLLRGCTLRNTEWVLCAVIFTGQETKIIQNSGNTPSKRALISRHLNWNVIYNFVVLGCMCLVAGFVEGFFWARSDTSSSFFEYGNYGNGNAALNGFITFFTCVILFQNLVPISLYISLEIVRTIQAYFIYSDTHMYYEPLDYPCTPKAWNICDDLGQIEYIFSDKTGTLTQNLMEFRKSTIGGVPYGEAYTEALAGMQKRQGIDTVKEGERAREQIARDKVRMIAALREQHDNPYLYDDELTFVAPDLVHDLSGASGEFQAKANYNFFLALALCHTVITERTPGNPPRIEFKAQSPDEAALVATARDCGFTVVGRTNEGIIVNIMGKEQEYTILNTLEFNSSRKRMSAIMRMPDGKIMLYCKGADSIIYSRLKAGEQADLRKSTAEHLEMYAREGLRTLCIAQREISEETYAEWNKKHDIAAASVENRDEKLEEVSDAIERDLTLLGGTAIEDRLQDGVPDSIELLGNAGIKLWVLTGDKVETAINIGFSCNLLHNDMDLIIFSIEDGDMDAAETQLDNQLANFGLTGSDKELKAAQADHSAPGPTHAVVIDGDSLRLCLDDRLRQKFLLLCKQCRSVLCCRVSPAQKADVVKLVKDGLKVITLAIGDGANDVAMIQAADVGVGIAGEEGRQAAMSSDFAVGQFRYLTRLTLVHGRWNYRRLAECIANFFYKQIVWTFALFWYQIYDNFDGSFIFNYTYVLLFNLAFTSLTVIFQGIFDQDISDKVSLAVPQLYRRGIEQKEWTQTKFWLYMLDGLYQSVVCYYLAYILFQPATFVTENGRQVDDVSRIGIYVGTAAIISINVYILMNTYRWDVATLGVAAFSILLVYAWGGIYTLFTASFLFYHGASEVFGTLIFWAQTLLTVVVALLPRFCIKAFQKIYFPMDIDIVREQVIMGKYKYLDDVDPSSPTHIMAKKISESDTSSDDFPKTAAEAPVRPFSEDERPMYPPSMAPTTTTGTRNPHSTQGSDESNFPQPITNRMSIDRPRLSLDRPRPSFDRMRSSMDQIRPSFEQSREMTSASYLSKVESSHR